MIIHPAEALDFEPWLALALEVEHLFGPMNSSLQFRLGLAEIITSGNACCIRESDGPPGSRLLSGGVIFLQETNEIAWLAVSRSHQGKGYGKKLLLHAIDQLDPGRDVRVQTFAPEVEQGFPARRLYLSLGFFDDHPAGPNAAGIPTLIMHRRKMA
jgi:GNAT superfamily N-acetyltransferase